MSAAVIAGVFVGGRGERLGGTAKGMLRGPDGRTLIDRWRALLASLGVPVVLVGRHAGYRDVDLEQLADEPPEIGPLGGMVALLRRAGSARALALACDMPFVSSATVERLLGSPAGPAAIAPRRGDRWEPLCALYDAPRVLPIAAARAARGARSLQGLLDEVAATPLLVDDRELEDWDTPEDLCS